MVNETYELWLTDVQAALQSINMSIDDWQKVWRFDFESEFNTGVRCGKPTPPTQHKHQ